MVAQKHEFVHAHRQGIAGFHERQRRQPQLFLMQRLDPEFLRDFGGPKMNRLEMFRAIAQIREVHDTFQQQHRLLRAKHRPPLFFTVITVVTDVVCACAYRYRRRCYCCWHQGSGRLKRAQQLAVFRHVRAQNAGDDDLAAGAVSVDANCVQQDVFQPGLFQQREGEVTVVVFQDAVVVVQHGKCAVAVDFVAVGVAGMVHVVAQGCD